MRFRWPRLRGLMDVVERFRVCGYVWFEVYCRDTDLHGQVRPTEPSESLYLPPKVILQASTTLIKDLRAAKTLQQKVKDCFSPA